MRSDGLFREVRSERGATLVVIAMSMVFLLGMAALAIDVGNLYTVRTELQRVADASALAGAGWLLVDPDDSSGAALEAIEFANENATGAQQFSMAAGDVDVYLDDFVVKTRVYATSDRATAVPTFFARILGINSANVATRAAAWAAPSSGVEPSGSWEDCLLPLGLLDYYDSNGDGTYTDGEPELGFDGDDHGLLMKFSFTSEPTGGPSACQTEPAWGGPDAPHVGVFNANPNVDYCNGYEDSWSCFWRKDTSSSGGGGGSDWLGGAIVGDQCVSLDAPSTVYQASAGGQKQSLIQSDDASGGPGSFRDVIEADLAENGGVDLVWCPAGSGGDNNIGCPKRGTCDGSCVVDNRRLRTAPIIDTENISGSGANNTFDISGFTGVFIEKVACSANETQFGGPEGRWNVYVRLITSGAGAGPGPADDEGGNASLRSLRLIPYDAMP